MPKKRAQPGSDYDSEDGFVVKKSRIEGSKAPASTSKSEDSSLVPGGGLKNAEGDEYWEIAHSRRLVVSEFKGKRMISIREYYEKDGQSLPGKKGITMPIAQFSTLVELLPHIEAVLRQKGEHLPRPDYSTSSRIEEDPDGNELEGDESRQDPEDEEAEEADPKKKNFEETSDED